MKFTSLVLLANIFPPATGFAPTANQRQLFCSNSNNNQAFGNAARATSSLDSLSMSISGILGAGAISIGLLTFTGEEASVTMYAPSVVISTTTADAIISSAQSPSALKEAEKKLAGEVKEAEKLARKDAKAAALEKRREGYFEYDLKRATEDEARLEANAEKFAAEAKKDEEAVLKLKAALKRDEELAAQATTKPEKLKILEEERRLVAQEKAIERKEKRAEKLGKVFLAEEAQEKKILEKKVEAERAEEAKFEKVEEEFEKAEAKFEEERAELDDIKRAEAKLLEKEGKAAKKRR
mmetsp:Transcript_24314/g.36030  ORF Transcript_24314/g.36030 Transcript_24314/m.36030 type:complete len:296 (+) Transcript_24314:135-1022(+)